MHYYGGTSNKKLKNIIFQFEFNRKRNTKCEEEMEDIKGKKVEGCTWYDLIGMCKPCFC